MEGPYDTLQAHRLDAPDIAQASMPMGMLLAWCANMHLLSAEVLQAHERLILRLRFEEALGSELLVACGGELSRDLFNEEGRRFLDLYYPNYMDDFREEFGPACYDVRDDWTNYRRMARVLTRAYLGAPVARGGRTGRGLFGTLKRWWNGA